MNGNDCLYNSMRPSFNAKFAKKYGIEKAIVAEWLYFHLNDPNYSHHGWSFDEYEGSLWASYDLDKIVEDFPILKNTKVVYLLRQLRCDGMIDVVYTRSGDRMFRLSDECLEKYFSGEEYDVERLREDKEGE